MTAKPKKKKFNWLTKLNALCKRKTKLPTREHEKLKDRAGEWPTCACGQLCKRLPRNHWGAPCDEELTNLGLLFMVYIERSTWHQALETFRKIEERSAKLLKEQ